MTSDTMRVFGTTDSPFTSKQSGSCGSNPCQGPDVFYAFTATKHGTAHVTLDTLENFSGAICYETGTCSVGSPDLCRSKLNMDQIVELDFAVTFGTTYNLVIDSYGTSVTGPFEFTIWIE